MIDEEPVFAFPDVDWDWTTIGGYREAVERARPATNVTTFVGHNTLRRFVIGGANRPPTAAELDRMRSTRPRGHRPGRARVHDRACRMRPGMFASVEELAALASVRRGAGPDRTTPTCATANSMFGRPSPRRSIPPTERRDPEHLAHVPAGEPAARGGGRAARHARRCPRTRGAGDLRPDDLPAWRRRVGAVVARLGA